MCTGGILSIESCRADPRGALVLQPGEWNDANLLRREGLKDFSSDAFSIAKERDGPAEEATGDPTGVKPGV